MNIRLYSKLDKEVEDFIECSVELEMPHTTKYFHLVVGIDYKCYKEIVTDLINRIVQVLREDLYWVRISARDAGLIELVKLWDKG